MSLSDPRMAYFLRSLKEKLITEAEKIGRAKQDVRVGTKGDNEINEWVKLK